MSESEFHVPTDLKSVEIKNSSLNELLTYLKSPTLEQNNINKVFLLVEKLRKNLGLIADGFCSEEGQVSFIETLTEKAINLGLPTTAAGELDLSATVINNIDTLQTAVKDQIKAKRMQKKNLNKRERTISEMSSDDFYELIEKQEVSKSEEKRLVSMFLKNKENIAYLGFLKEYIKFDKEFLTKAIETLKNNPDILIKGIQANAYDTNQTLRYLIKKGFERETVEIVLKNNRILEIGMKENAKETNKILKKLIKKGFQEEIGNAFLKNGRILSNGLINNKDAISEIILVLKKTILKKNLKKILDTANIKSDRILGITYSYSLKTNRRK